MKKILLVFIGAMMLFAAGCQREPAGVNNQDTETKPDTEITDNDDTSDEDEEEGSGETSEKPEGVYLDLTVSRTYEMNIGNSIRLWSENEASYEIQIGEDVVSVSRGNVLTALGAGDSFICMKTKNGNSYFCQVTVKAVVSEEETEDGETTVVNDLIGKWYDGDSYIQFNGDGSGYMLVYLNSSVVQDVSFSWIEWKNAYGRYVEISNANDYLNGKQYTVTVEGNKLTLKGYLAFGKAQTTVWYK